MIVIYVNCVFGNQLLMGLVIRRWVFLFKMYMVVQSIDISICSPKWLGCIKCMFFSVWKFLWHWFTWEITELSFQRLMTIFIRWDKREFVNTIIHCYVFAIETCGFGFIPGTGVVSWIWTLWLLCIYYMFGLPQILMVTRQSPTLL